MPDDKEKQYSIRLSMTVEKDGEVFNSNEIEWKQLRYDGAVLIQKVMLDALNALNDAGIENAKRKGQGAMFEAQG